MEDLLRDVCVAIAAQWLDTAVSAGTPLYEAIDIAVRAFLVIKNKFGVSDEIDALITEFSKI